MEVTKMVDQLTIKPDGQLEVREREVFTEGGEVLFEKYHRKVLHPGASLVNEAEATKAVAALIHTPEAIAAFRVKMEVK